MRCSPTPVFRQPGTLIFLGFNVVGTAGSATTGSTNLRFNSFVFNEGDPAAMTTNGTFTVINPTSAVNALPATQPNPIFTVSWAGQDPANGSGLQNYDVWVAENDGAYQPFISETSASFTGQLGKTYRFYSIARDNAGDVEFAPNASDAITRMLAPTAALSGRVTTSSGRGIANARLTLTDHQGASRSATSNSFGYFILMKFRQVKLILFPLVIGVISLMFHRSLFLLQRMLMELIFRELRDKS